VVAGGEELALDPAAAGLRVDAAATADEAVSGGLLDQLRSRLGGGRDLDPVVDADEPALRSALEALAPAVARTAAEGSVRFDATPAPVAVPPVAGRALDLDASVEAVREQWLREDQVELPVELEEVETTDEDVQQAVREIAEPAIAAPLVVDAGGQELVVPPAAIAKALTVVADADGELGPRLDEAALHAAVGPGLRSVGTPARDARFDLSSGAPVVVPSAAGRTVSPADLSAAVLGVLTDPAPRRAAAPLTPAEPRLTTQEAQALGVKEVIGSFTTRHPCCAPRVTNIHRIADIVDGHLLLPGERFDLNALTGPRDRARGFVDAPQILEGEFVDRIGGGISQFVTTMFNAVFFSGLKDVEHSPHSYYISRYPPGREATISYPEPDFVFENDSPTGVLVQTSYTDTSITVTFWGTKRFDEVRSVTGPRTRVRDFDTQYVQREDCTATSGEQGFDIVVTREFVRGGRVVEREPFRTRYKPEPRFVCGPPPSGTPTT
jgi:vancomycin resistance protein YoaR